MSALILVVDDEPDVADLFRQQFRKELRSSRFAMEFAQSAPEALERVGAAENARLILILSDVNMPGMSGLELLPRARKARPDVPVIMITAYGDADTRRKAIEGGAAGPLHQADRLSRTARRDRAPAGRRDGSSMTAKILVVDDEPDLEDLVTQKFRRQIKDGSIAFGFARDGVEALAFLAENRDFDMVVSDINMPRMDGLTLLAKLQDEATRFSTVIVSAYGDMANIRTAMNRGAFDFLTKPIDFADFETTVRKTIAHVADLRDARQRQAAAERAHASLSRYFSPNLARSLAADANALAPGGERREIATLFTDIAGFTPLVESLDPRQLASLLSGYLEGMTEIVFAHEGTVAKIIGDAIHVLFGAPGDQPDAASRAIACALALDARSEDYRLEWKARGVPLGVTRIGVHAGPAIVGNFGGGRLFDYTAYGDTINAAARLEAVNKQLGTRICVSAAAAERADGFLGRPVGDLVLRGRKEPMRVFEPLTPEESASPHTVAYRRRLRQARGGRPRRARRLRRPDRRTAGRRARPISPEAAAQRRRRNADRDGLGSFEAAVTFRAPSLDWPEGSCPVRNVRIGSLESMAPVAASARALPPRTCNRGRAARFFARAAASSAFAASRSATNAGSAWRRATVAAPMKRPSMTSLSQWTLQTTRLSPKARPRARIASLWSGDASARTSAQAQPIDV